MKISHMRWFLAVLPAATLVACGGGGDADVTPADAKSSPLAAKPSGSTLTAQAIWSDFGAESTEIVVTENRKYDFQAADFCQGSLVTAPDATTGCADGTVPTRGAASYFGAAYVTTASWSCSGNATNCDPSNQPAIPPQPAAPMDALLDQAKCALWWGEALPSSTKAMSTGPLAGANGRGNWTYTRTFALDPNDSLPVAPRSGYGYQVLGDAGTVDLALGGFVYGQSAQSLAKGTRKYSFSMRASDGSVRVTNTAISVTRDGASVASFSQADGTLSAQLQENLQANNNFLPVDFTVPADPGSAGTGFLALRNYDLKLLTFDAGARDILNNTNGVSFDNFSGNDNGGADGTALARVALVPASTVALEGGTYTVAYSGQVKELNADGTVQSFTVARTIHVVGEPGTCKRN